MDNAPAASHNVAGSNEDRIVKTVAWTLTVACLIAFAAAHAGGIKVYRWVDEHGGVHYGDQVPPQYATHEHDVVNSEGVVVQRTQAQKSPEALAAEEQQAAAAQEQHNRDQNLLNTYASVAEIESLRDQRLALVSDQIKVTGQFLDILNDRLGKLRARSLHFTPYSDDPKAPPMPDQVAEDLVRVGNDIQTQQQNLREKQNEEATMKAQFGGDIQRFKALKGIH